MKPTQEQVIAWAREAGIHGINALHIGTRKDMLTPLFDLVDRVYEAGRKDENEACAIRVSEVDADGWEVNMAEIIRARGALERLNHAAEDNGEPL